MFVAEISSQTKRALNHKIRARSTNLKIISLSIDDNVRERLVPG